MKAVLIDDEIPAIEELSYLLKEYGFVNIIGTFTNPLEAFDFIKKEKPDIIFLDIDMPEIGGIELGLKIQEMSPYIIIVFVTAYSHYALDAFKAYPLDYILKPIDEERFAKTMKHILENSADKKEKESSKLSIRCFGKFDMKCGNETVKFAINKSRELLIFLICHINEPISREDLLYLLFGSKDKKIANNFRVTLCRLRNTLSIYNIDPKDMTVNNTQLTISDGICDYVDICRFFHKNITIDENNIHEAVRLIKLCNGELFADLDVLWMYDIREWFHINLENLVLKSAIYYINNNELAISEKLLLYLLKLNPISDQGYSMLLDIYKNSGNMVKYNLYYREYIKMLEEELGEIPDQKYINFYNATD